MRILLEDAGKRYGRHWIFSHCTEAFSAPEKIALLGANGSGKSTLLRIIAGMQGASTGKVQYKQDGGQTIAQDQVFQHLTFCAPGMELPEEMTLREVLQFHFTFKRRLPGYDIRSIIAATGLEAHADMPIGDYSSGMRQRVKLAQAIFSDTPILLLDEPCTNLDEAGVLQYQQWITDHAARRLVIVASNDPREYGFCQRQILMENLTQA